MVLSEKRKKLLFNTFKEIIFLIDWVIPPKLKKKIKFDGKENGPLELFPSNIKLEICKHGLLSFYHILCHEFWRYKKESILLKIGTNISDTEKAKIALVLIRSLLPKINIEVDFEKCNLDDKYHKELKYHFMQQAETLEDKIELNAIAIEENSEEHQCEAQRLYEMYGGMDEDDEEPINEDFIPWKYRRLYDLSKQANKRFKRVKLWK